MNRIYLLPLLVLPYTGCSAPFGQPDIHIRQAESLPEEAVQMKHNFALPESLTEVYYFTTRHLRCDYYLRGKLDKEGALAYEAKLVERNSDIKTLPGIPDQVSGSSVAVIKDWWPQRDSQNLHVYEIRNLDIVMIDIEEGIVYCVLCGD